MIPWVTVPRGRGCHGDDEVPHLELTNPDPDHGEVLASISITARSPGAGADDLRREQPLVGELTPPRQLLHHVVVGDDEPVPDMMTEPSARWTRSLGMPPKKSLKKGSFANGEVLT